LGINLQGKTKFSNRTLYVFRLVELLHVSEADRDAGFGVAFPSRLKRIFAQFANFEPRRPWLFGRGYSGFFVDNSFGVVGLGLGHLGVSGRHLAVWWSLPCRARRRPLRRTIPLSLRHKAK